MTAPAASRNARKTAPHAIPATARRDRRPPMRPQTTNPAKGSSGSRGISPSTISPLEQVQLVHLNRFLVAEQRDDDGEADRDLAGGDADDEGRERLTRQVGDLPETGEGDEVEVRRVEHQLDRHEDDDRVAAREDAEHADREEHDREQEQMVGSDTRSLKA